jgi:hypothetical protein
MMAFAPLFRCCFGVGIALSTYLGSYAKGLPIGMAAGAVAIVVQFSWPLRRELWFWLAIAALTVVNAWAVLSLSWSWVDSMRNGIRLLGFVWVGDSFAMGAIIYGLFASKTACPHKLESRATTICPGTKIVI